MGFNDYILTCERDNKELSKDLEYYKNQNIRLKKENKKQKEVIDMFLNKVEKNKMLLNNPDLLDLYLKIKDVSE